MDRQLWWIDLPWPCTLTRWRAKHSEMTGWWPVAQDGGVGARPPQERRTWGGPLGAEADGELVQQRHAGGRVEELDGRQEVVGQRGHERHAHAQAMRSHQPPTAMRTATCSSVPRSAHAPIPPSCSPRRIWIPRESGWRRRRAGGAAAGRDEEAGEEGEGEGRQRRGAGEGGGGERRRGRGRAPGSRGGERRLGFGLREGVTAKVPRREVFVKMAALSNFRFYMSK